MFAVIKTGGKQYKVSAEDVITIEKLNAEPGETVTFDEVLMLGGDQTEVGAPLVSGASVVGEVVEQGRGRKIIVFKKKRRQGYKRTRGHRQLETTVRITEILTGGASPKAARAKAPKAEEKPATEAKAKAPAETAAAQDDLKKLTGVGPAMEKKLIAAGITSFAQLAALGPEEITRVEEEAGARGKVEGWVEEAKSLA